MLVTVILVALIICFMVVTIFSLTAMLIVRRREQKYEGAQKLEKAIGDLDVALDTALKEINKMGGLVKADVDEKYKSMLFLYSLVEEKQKEIAETSDGAAISEMMSQYIETHGDKLRQIAQVPETVRPVQVKSDVITSAEREMLDLTPASEPTMVESGNLPRFTNPKHRQIWEMRKRGKAIADIARELSMGQGEVKLILDLIDRS